MRKSRQIALPDVRADAAIGQHHVVFGLALERAADDPAGLLLVFNPRAQLQHRVFPGARIGTSPRLDWLKGCGITG